jgi:hypothetical protein
VLQTTAFIHPPHAAPAIPSKRIINSPLKPGGSSDDQIRNLGYPFDLLGSVLKMDDDHLVKDFDLASLLDEPASIVSHRASGMLPDQSRFHNTRSQWPPALRFPAARDEQA